jgi:Flp pilus assembly protein TadD
MSGFVRNSGLVLFCLLAIAGLTAISRTVSAQGGRSQPTAAYPTGGVFSPSNARTVNGNLIPADQFFPAARCARCHQDTHAAWSQSLHRNAAREPFYRESADILLRTRGVEFTRHCESCHTPIALFSGALSRENPNQKAPFTPLDNEGLTCSVCHSIVEARLDGTGSFTIRRPALLAKEDGTPIYGDFTDEEILDDVPAHRRAVMRPLLRQPEFCATCHKVDAPPTLNGYKRIRGFSAYDEWQQSGASGESVTPFYRREQRVDCRGCHMPKVESNNDRAAKNGVIASHRWLAANVAAPLFYGQTEQVEKTISFLEGGLVSADIFALKREATGELIAPLSSSSANNISLKPGEEVCAEVVISNRKIAHSFAPEVRDLYEIWVEFTATDDAGRTVFRSGFLKPDKMLDESAHTYKAILLDEKSRPITRHQIWLTKALAYNTGVPAGRSDVARFRFRVPQDSPVLSAPALTLQARVLYRRFNQEFTNFVLQRQQRDFNLPIVPLAQAGVRIGASLSNAQPSDSSKAAPEPNDELQAIRWNDYGIGLLEQSQYGEAAAAFRQASKLNPRDPDMLISAAVAELKTERFGPERRQLQKAAELLDQALKIAPTLARARFYHALVLRAQDQTKMAAEELTQLAREYPRDREVQRQLGQSLYALGRVGDACTAFEAVLAVDPTDAGAYQFLGPAYESLGRHEQAATARALYLQWRDDPMAAGVAARFFAENPSWADERVPAHAHGDNSPPRPTLTGRLAAPDK